MTGTILNTYVTGGDAESTLVVVGFTDTVGDSIGDTVDVAAYQSVSVQISGTFVGTNQFQVSNDGVTWVSKSLTSSIAAIATSAGATGGIFSGDLGARYFRILTSALTSGTVQIALLFMPESQSNATPSGTGTQAISGAVTATPSGVTEQAETTANLAAGATYTGAARDLGTTAGTRASIVRPLVMHLAGLNPGQLILQESTDGTTWRQTRNQPIPSDGSYRTFEWPVHTRYYRFLFVNTGAAAQTGMFLHAIRTQGDGGTLDAQANMSFLLSTTALAAGASFTGPTLDLGDNHSWNVTRCRVNLGTASSTVTVQLQSSHDGTTWAASPQATATTTAAGIVAIERPITERYVRLVVTNGATAQASNQMTMALVSL